MTIRAVKTTPDAKHGPEDSLKSLPMGDLFKKLDSTKAGLTQSEAAKRLTQYGPNALTEKKNKFISEVPRILLWAESWDD